MAPPPPPRPRAAFCPRTARGKVPRPGRARQAEVIKGRCLAKPHLVAKPKTTGRTNSKTRFPAGDHGLGLVSFPFAPSDYECPPTPAEPRACDLQASVGTATQTREKSSKDLESAVTWPQTGSTRVSQGSGRSLSSGVVWPFLHA